MLPAGEASPPEEFARLLAELAPRFGVELLPAVLAKMARFLAALDRARRETNLTGPISAAELAEHALESVLAQRLIPPSALVLDVGSGAGFPGLPLAIARPDIRVTPVEPRRKRIEFLEAVVESVPIENVLAPKTRLSEIPAASVDAGTARAVGQIERVLDGAPFLRPRGLFLGWTTDAERLGRLLAPVFELEKVIAVPGTRRKAIAMYRKTDVPRGT